MGRQRVDNGATAGHQWGDSGATMGWQWTDAPVQQRPRVNCRLFVRELLATLMDPSKASETARTILSRSKVYPKRHNALECTTVAAHPPRQLGGFACDASLHSNAWRLLQWPRKSPLSGRHPVAAVAGRPWCNSGRQWGDSGATVERQWGDSGATVGRQWGDSGAIGT
jgi:hypothetical protein